MDTQHTNSSSSSYWYEDDYDPVPGIEEFKHVFNTLLTLFSLLGVFLNICVIKYSQRLRRTTGDLTHSFVCSMASADLLLCCFAQPFEFLLHKLTSTGMVHAPEWICRTQHCVYWLGYSASGLSLTLLNLDKLLFFKWPLHYGMVGTKKTAVASIWAAWIVCLAGSVVMVVPEVLQLSPRGDCGTVTINAHLYISYTILFCILPVLSSAVVSVYLSKLVQEMRRSNSGYSTTLFSDYTVQQRLRAMAFIFITTAWTFVALTPFRLFNIVRLYEAPKWYTDRRTMVSVHWMGYVFLFILSLNPSINACLTLITYAPYKNLFKTHLFKVKAALCSLMGRPIPEQHRPDSDGQSGRYSLTQSDWV